MPNKKTIALDDGQYNIIINTLLTGAPRIRANERVAAALMLEANIGVRISDILALKLSSFIRDGGRYRLNIKEQKTQKQRDFTVPDAVVLYAQDYATRHGISRDERLFPVSERAVQKALKAVCDYLGYEGISTHSFRKYFAMGLYKDTGNNILLVQTALQHSSPNITRRYLGVQQAELEAALKNRVNLPGFTRE